MEPRPTTVRPAMTGIRRLLIRAFSVLRPAPGHAVCRRCLQSAEGPHEASIYLPSLGAQLLSLCCHCRRSLPTVEALPFYLADLRVLLSRMRRVGSVRPADAQQAGAAIAENVLLGAGTTPLTLTLLCERALKERALRREHELADTVRPLATLLRDVLAKDTVGDVAFSFERDTAKRLTVALVASDLARASKIGEN